MFYNKLHGLKFLQRTLKGKRGVSVLPWRVYNSPDEFREEHFPNAQRLLIRTNLRGSLTHTIWTNLPREDVFENPKQAMHRMLEEWKKKVATEYELRDDLETSTAKPDSLHFIVHSVKPRIKYRANIRITHFSPGGPNPQIKIGRLVGNDVWRLGTSWRSLTPECIFDELVDRVWLTRKQASIVTRKIQEVCKVLQEQLKREGLGHLKFEASASISRDKPTHLEFYDFLLKQ